MAWEYELAELQVLCEPCHGAEHEDRAFLNLVLLGAEPGFIRQLACFIGGYLDGTCSLDDPNLRDILIHEGPFYDLGMAAACLEYDAAREIVESHVRTKPSTPSMQRAVEEWAKQ